MKRILASALVLSAISGFGLVGCSETEKHEVRETTQDTGGTTTVTNKEEIKKSSDTAPIPGQPGTGGSTSTTTK